MGEQLELWIDHRYVRSGYAWSFPATRGGAHRGGLVLAGAPRQGDDRAAGVRAGTGAEGYQGNWIPHELRPAVEDGVFYAGDSAGHCLPLTAEGIRTALYFGLACARELRMVHEGQRTRGQALARYGAFSDRHARKYRWLQNAQRTIGRLTPTPVTGALTWSLQSRRFATWIFEHYLDIAPPSYVEASPRRTSSHVQVAVPVTV